MTDHDPREDPQPGDIVVSRGERQEVLAILKHDLEPSLGPGPHVEVRHKRVDGLGSQTRCTMSLETWRYWAREEGG